MVSDFLKCLAVLASALLIGAVGSASAATKAEQTIGLGNASNSYPFVVFANTDLQQTSSSIERAVVITHGIKRNADDYYATGLKLLSNAQVAPGGTLLLAPDFLEKSDALASSNLPLWHKGSWIQGEASTLGHSGVTSFQALDDIVGYLSDRKRFPALKEIVLIGHSAGAQLMQRYAVFNNQDAALQHVGIAMRYVISSPSSYVYFDPSRPQNQGFAPVSSTACADYNQYRYGLDQPPAYLKAQNLTAQQLFKRYASRNVTYLVGADDTDPNHRVLDKSCGAEEQGDSRVARQLNYVGYEQFLAQKWQIAVHHPQFEVPGVAHDANGIYGSQIAAQRLFPTH
ncbi:hypothetical protein [Pseudomonas sp.]|uniref:hypothetical protein n=1 Tax=Pseudomonas sp. TaxID=306 RepID=UPI00262CBF4E|nr:hypothetical protein [Pseudomonas sp.]